MSARFGRNQKRQMREEIARLKSEVNHHAQAVIDLQCGGWKQATGEHMDLEHLIEVITSRDVREITERNGRKRRTASLTAYARNHDKLVAFTYQTSGLGLVEWDGIVWKMDDIGIETTRSGAMYLGTGEIELELEAIGSGARLPNYALTSSSPTLSKADCFDGPRFYGDNRPSITIRSREIDLYHVENHDAYAR